MSERRNDRWRQLKEVDIPPIRKPGFESSVLRRDIWDQASPQQAGLRPAPEVPKKGPADTDILFDAASPQESAFVPSGAAPDAKAGRSRSGYVPAPDPWETDAPDQIPDDMWEDSFEETGVKAKTAADPIPATQDPAQSAGASDLVFEMPVQTFEPEPAPAPESAPAFEPDAASEPDATPELKEAPEPAAAPAAAVLQPAEPAHEAVFEPAEPAADAAIEPAAPAQPAASATAEGDGPAFAADPVPEAGLDGSDLFEEGTVLLTDRNIRLIRAKDPGEVIRVTGDSFILGKSRKADYPIAGNPAISRIHAHIYRIGEDYYIEDRNSLNHTYVDEEMITGPYKLRSGLVIRLANEDFILKME